MTREILGVKVSNTTWQEALESVQIFLADNRQHLVTSPNPEMVVLAQTDREYRRILNTADLAIPDGTGIIFASWFLGRRLKKKIPGVDFVWQLMRLAEKKDQAVYLLGGQGGVAARAALVLKNRFPRLKIFTGGDDASPDDEGLVEKIKLAQPSILLVAFGHGRQEKWIDHHLSQLPSISIAMGVGGAFDFMAGRVKRAPKLMRVLGLEWLWRLILEPWRWRRILTATCKFSWLVLKFRCKK